MSDPDDSTEYHSTERILDAIERASDAKIIRYLIHNGPATSKEIILETDLTQPTVYKRMSYLRDTDAILQFEKSTMARGRNPVKYDVADTESRVNRTDAVRVPPEAKNLPPSAKLVAVIMSHNQPVTQKELVKMSNMSQRTVRDGLDRLEPYLKTEPNFRDARQTLYRYEPTEADTPDDSDSDGVTVPRHPSELQSE